MPRKSLLGFHQRTVTRMVDDDASRQHSTEDQKLCSHLVDFLALTIYEPANLITAGHAANATRLNCSKYGLKCLLATPTISSPPATLKNH